VLFSLILTLPGPIEFLWVDLLPERSACKKTLIAVKKRLWFFVQEHEPVLREELFFVQTLRVQALGPLSGIPSMNLFQHPDLESAGHLGQKPACHWAKESVIWTWFRISFFLTLSKNEEQVSLENGEPFNG